VSVSKVAVSVVVANYNNGKYLEDFFSSFLRGTLLPAEMVIVDDGSLDDSLSIINGFRRNFEEKGINLVVFALDKNVGFANALNIAIRNSSQDFLLRIDPDDMIAPNRIEKQVQFLEENKNIDVLGSNVSYFDSTLGDFVFVSNVAVSGIVDKLKKGLLPLIHGSVMIRRQALENCRYFQDCVPAEDYDLFCQMAVKGCKFHNLQEALTFVRIHRNSVSNDLQFSTIQKYADLRLKYWGVGTHKLLTYLKYIHLRFYRKFLFHHGFMRYGYLILAVCANPKSLINRMTRVE
jgi:glycosyltransferase involved in cell wall biosynthesis